MHPKEVPSILSVSATPPGRGRSWFLALLCIYSGLLILGAWREEIRPSAFEGASRWAKRSLARFGIPTGIPVFQGSGAGPILQGTCVTVRARSEQGPSQQIAPTKGPCPPEGWLLMVPVENTFLKRLLVEITTRMRRVERATASSQTMTSTKRLLKALAHHFGRKAPEAKEFALQWSLHSRDYESGDAVVQDILFLSWSRGKLQEMTTHWFPSPEQRDAVWKEWER